MWKIPRRSGLYFRRVCETLAFSRDQSRVIVNAAVEVAPQNVISIFSLYKTLLYCTFVGTRNSYSKK